MSPTELHGTFLVVTEVVTHQEEEGSVLRKVTQKQMTQTTMT